ncbi:MAG TPA: hypothetical protein VFB62_01920 [Polyangiaceae bacterium]|nr:hypothetical protein [Polyangiaceae bacterium]
MPGLLHFALPLQRSGSWHADGARHSWVATDTSVPPSVGLQQISSRGQSAESSHAKTMTFAEWPHAFKSAAPCGDCGAGAHLRVLFLNSSQQTSSPTRHVALPQRTTAELVGVEIAEMVGVTGVALLDAGAPEGGPSAVWSSPLEHPAATSATTKTAV